MTAITLPLKKFPGQTIEREIYFGGLKTAQPLVLATLTLFAFYALRLSMSRTPVLVMIFSLMPLIWAMVSYVYYVVRTRISGRTLLDASLVELNQLFHKEKVYFNRVSILGAIMTFASLGVAMNQFYGARDVTSLSVTVVSVLAFQIYIGSIIKGLFSKKDILRYCALTVLLEASALLLVHIDYKLVLLVLVLSMTCILLSRRALRNLGLNVFLQKTVS